MVVIAVLKFRIEIIKVQAKRVETSHSRFRLNSVYSAPSPPGSNLEYGTIIPCRTSHVQLVGNLRRRDVRRDLREFTVNLNEPGQIVHNVYTHNTEKSEKSPPTNAYVAEGGNFCNRRQEGSNR